MLNAAIDANLYTVDEMAADLNLLRLALGYGQFDILAGGFGSELAWIMVRDYPQAVRSVVLIEVAFPKTYWTAEMQAVSLQRSLDLLFNTCTTDEKCRLAYPGLESQLYALVDQLNTFPAEVTLFFPGENHLSTVKVSGYDFLILLQDMLFYRSTFVDIPRLVIETSKGDTNKIAVELQQYGIMPSEVAELTLGLEINARCEGLHASFWQASPASRDVQPVVLEAVLAEWRVYQQVCPLWTGREPGLPSGQAITSEVPVMVFQGEFTPDYSPEIVAELLRGMKNAAHFVVPRASHDAFSGGSCAGQVLHDWLENPGSNLDSSCLNNTEPLNFRLPDQ
jgi:pimeloyl-ACP methyl ester carboxylesterase